jgi:hypothetical protein
MSISTIRCTGDHLSSVGKGKLRAVRIAGALEHPKMLILVGFRGYARIPANRSDVDTTPRAAQAAPIGTPCPS